MPSYISIYYFEAKIEDSTQSSSEKKDKPHLFSVVTKKR